MILDSNIVIYSIQPNYSELRDYLLGQAGNLYASEITKLEVMGFHRLNENNGIYFGEFFSSIKELSINSVIISEAIRLRQQRKRSLGDAIIAATALVHNLPVVTNNGANFSTIEGLSVISLDSILAGTA